MIIPGKEVKKMSIDEKYNNNKELEEREETQEYNNKRVFQQSNYSYGYYEMVDNIFRIKCDFFIRKERLEIIEKLLDLKYQSFFRDFIEQAILNLVELDLNSPESILKIFVAT